MSLVCPIFTVASPGHLKLGSHRGLTVIRLRPCIPHMQTSLFDRAENMPEGLHYEAGFLSISEEASLLEMIRALPLHGAEYKQFIARRRIVSFGGRYDFSNHVLQEAPPIPEWLQALRARAARWADVAVGDIHHALVAEYTPGTPLGWHRDVPEFEAIVGVSLGGTCRMRFRRYPPVKPARAELHLDLAPRSIYTLQGPARWQWQHSVSPTKELRYSITFRTERRKDRVVGRRQ